MRPKSVCEDMLVGNFFTEKPPPVPPPPLNYSTYTTQVSAGITYTSILIFILREYVVTLFKLQSIHLYYMHIVLFVIISK